jgi:hypothetical protein
MESELIDESDLYRTVADSGARALLIGRRAMVVLGAPVGTWDYDFWVHPDDIEVFNAALAPLGLLPNRSPDEARRRGRYILEGDERVDVSREVSAVGGEVARLEDLLARCHRFEVADGAAVAVPLVSDLITTKRFALRAKDVEDIRILEALREEMGE